MADPADLQAKLKLLSEAYAAQLPGKLEQIEQAWAQLPHDEWDNESFETLHRMVHSLTGSGKTFGFSLLGEAARSLESYLRQLAPLKTPLSEEQCQHVEALICELHQAALHKDAAPDNQPGLIAVAQPAKSTSLQPARRIFAVGGDITQTEELRTQLSYFGYTVSVFHRLDDFRLAMQSNPDVVVLMDISFSEGNRGGVNIINELQRGRTTPIPVLFLSSHTDFKTRLEAVRAGGIAYLNKPVNVGNLIDKLDSLTSAKTVAPYRVLIVDDSVELTANYAAVLEQAGMKVLVINDPLNVLEPLLEFSPDLILIDIYMPECSGMELARVIRQLDAFVSIPIVFLSAESNLGKQLSAMSLGGDDFLTKPIQPEHLVSSVTNRIKRSFLLRSFMVRDSLTGLLNHTTIKDQLNFEIARANRQKMPLTFAMVDIDNFKQVNDTYGHPAGDVVIKSLARLLKQRLRETDAVGRYGGEEFAVILGNTDGASAIKVLNGIRKDFSQLRHLADGKEFFVTFSCGIADIAHFSDATRLGDAADKALYKAKRAGRNQVILADVSD